MRYLLFSVLILVLPSVADAQIIFERWYGGTKGENGYSVAQTTDGGYIITGRAYLYGTDEDDVYLIKTDSLGDTLWTKTYGGTGCDIGNSVAQTSDGGYIIAGKTISYGAGGYDVYLIKTNASGDTLWTKTYGGTDYDKGYSVIQTTDGGYVIAGATLSYGAGYWDVYLIKTDSIGDTLWTRTYGGTDYDGGHSVALTTDGGYIITGYTYSYGAAYQDVYLIKTDFIGDTLWTSTYGDISWDASLSVAQTTDGGYIIAGYSDSYGTGKNDVYLIKTDSLGDTLWTKTYGGTGCDIGFSVAQTPDEGYIIAGLTESYGSGYEDVYLIKTNSSGDTSWTRTYGGTSHDEGYSVAQTSDGGYIIAGKTISYGAGGYDVYLIKTDANGYSGVEEKIYLRHKTTDFRLVCYPNPFTTSTTITFTPPSIGQSAKGIGLKIYDVSGRLIKNFLISKSPDFKVKWDGKSKQGKEVKNGIYFINLEGRNIGKVIKVK